MVFILLLFFFELEGDVFLYIVNELIDVFYLLEIVIGLDWVNEE